MARRTKKELCLYVEKQAMLLAKDCARKWFTLDQYVAEQGIKVHLEDLSENTNGYNENIAGKWRILLNRNLPPLGQEYTIGHELGHILLNLKNEDAVDEFATALYYALPAAAVEHDPDNPHIDPVRDWWRGEKEPSFDEIMETVLFWETPHGKRARKRFYDGVRMVRITREDRERHGQ